MTIKALAITATALTIGLAACGGGSTNPSSPTPVAQTTPTPTTPGSGPTTVTITITSNNGVQSFSPNPASIQNGQLVVWRNADTVTHRVVLNDGSLDTGDLPPGASSAAISWVAEAAQYHCSLHPTMVGSVNTSTTSPSGPCDPYYGCQ